MTIPELYKAALKAEKETGIPAIFVVAQAIQEQGWHIVPIDNSNNIFGIKYHNKKWGCVEALTTEFEDGVEYHKRLKFQKYPALADCVKDHTELLTKYSYAKCLENYKKDKDLKAYVQCVAKDYATDPDYADKVMNVISSIKKTLEVMNVNDEFKKDRDLMVKMGIFKPYGGENEYWTTHITREELAVILTRFLDSMTVTIKIDGKSKSKTYTTGGEK